MQKWRNESFVDVVNLILGAWLFVTPWIFGFADGAAGWNAWILGALIAIVAIAALTAFADGRSGSISCSGSGELSRLGRSASRRMRPPPATTSSSVSSLPCWRRLSCGWSIANRRTSPRRQAHVPAKWAPVRRQEHAPFQMSGWKCRGGPGDRPSAFWRSAGDHHILAGCARITASLTAVPQPAPVERRSSPFSIT
jgi:hypothetical protein